MVESKYTLTLDQLEYGIRNFQSRFEREHGIKPKNVIKMQDKPYLKIYLVEKEDGSSTINIAFQTSPGQDSWLVWTPTKDQAEWLITHFEIIYTEIDARNKAIKQGF